MSNGNGKWKDLPRDAFWKSGSGGHCLYVVPSLGLVVYKMGGRDEQYNPANTGFAAVGKYDGSRESWRAAAPLSEAAYAETLRLVLAMH